MFALIKLITSKLLEDLQQPKFAVPPIAEEN